MAAQHPALLQHGGIAQLCRLGSGIYQQHGPDPCAAGERRPEQQHNRHQQHGQKLHQQVWPEITCPALLGQLPVTNRQHPRHEQWYQQAPAGSNTDTFADHGAEECHECQRHRQPVPYQGRVGRAQVVVRGTRTHQQQGQKEHLVDPEQPRQSTRHLVPGQQQHAGSACRGETEAGRDIQEIGNAQQRADIGKDMVREVLGNGWQLEHKHCQQQAEPCHQAALE